MIPLREYIRLESKLHTYNIQILYKEFLVMPQMRGALTLLSVLAPLR